MPDKIDPNSKRLYRARVENAKRRKRKPQAPSSSDSSQNGTPRPEIRHQRAEREIKTEDIGILYLHLAMRLGLKSLPGVPMSLEPAPDRATGLYPNTLDYDTKVRLMREIIENGSRLYWASYSEKKAIVNTFDKKPGRLADFVVKLKEWARKNKRDLYKQYIETAFAEFTRICNESEAGKTREAEELREKMLEVLNSIRSYYEKDPGTRQ